MAQFEILSLDHRGVTVLVAKLTGQAERDTLAHLGVELVRRATGGAPLRILLDQGELRPGLILPYDIGAIVDDWRALIRRTNVRLAAYTPNPVIFGLNRLGLSIAARDAGDRVKVFSTRDEALDWLVAP